MASTVNGNIRQGAGKYMVGRWQVGKRQREEGGKNNVEEGILP